MNVFSIQDEVKSPTVNLVEAHMRKRKKDSDSESDSEREYQDDGWYFPSRFSKRYKESSPSSLASLMESVCSLNSPRSEPRNTSSSTGKDEDEGPLLDWRQVHLDMKIVLDQVDTE